MCRKDERWNLSKGVLTGLLGFDPHASATLVSNQVDAALLGDDKPLPAVLPQVSFAWLKHTWSVGDKEKALAGLTLLVDSLETCYNSKGEFISDPHPLAERGAYADYANLTPKEVQQFRAKM